MASKSPSTELKKACEKFQNSLDQLQTDVVSCKDNITVEDNILHLKETAEFINAKIKVINVSDVAVKNKNYENVNIENERSDVIKSIINSQHNDDAACYVLKCNALQYVKQNDSKDAVSEIYKQKVIEQLELLKENCERTLKLYERKEQVLSDTLEVSMLIMQKQNTFNKILAEKSIEYQKECIENLSDAYKENLAKIKQRIQKINFMNVLINRLIFVGINWKEQPEFKEMLKVTRSPVSIDSLLKE